jgi:hypothetical protein
VDLKKMYRSRSRSRHPGLASQPTSITIGSLGLPLVPLPAEIHRSSGSLGVFPQGADGSLLIALDEHGGERGATATTALFFDARRGAWIDARVERGNGGRIGPRGLTLRSEGSSFGLGRLLERNTTRGCYEFASQRGGGAGNARPSSARDSALCDSRKQQKQVLVATGADAPIVQESGCGWAFEVAVDGDSHPLPLSELDCFPPDAMSVDPETGLFCVTDDGLISGFYRFRARRAQRELSLQQGAVLEVLRARRKPNGELPPIRPGGPLAAQWVPVATFDGNERWLYVNIQTPGIPFALTGPWNGRCRPKA